MESLICYRCLKVVRKDNLIDKFIKQLRKIKRKIACPDCKCTVFIK